MTFIHTAVAEANIAKEGAGAAEEVAEAAATAGKVAVGLRLLAGIGFIVGIIVGIIELVEGAQQYVLGFLGSLLQTSHPKLFSDPIADRQS
jgi:hypothetical protein